MGIKSLTKLINNNTIKGIQHVKIDYFKGKTIAIDASIVIYQSLINIPNTNSSKEVNHILGIYYKTINYLSNNITPIYIFDGKPPDGKLNLLKERKEKANNAHVLMNTATNTLEKERYKKQTIRIKKYHIDDIKILLQLMGISYIHMDGEGEAIASELCRIKYVDYVFTEDMDVLAYNSPYLVRSCIDKAHKRKDMYSIFDKEKILIDLEINNDEFIELCVLCGCDYCPNIPRIGIVKSLQIIKKYKSISNYLKNNNITKLPDDYIHKYNLSVQIFNSYKGIFDNGVNINRSTLDVNKLTNFLINDCNIENTRVQKSINKIIHINK